MRQHAFRSKVSLFMVLLVLSVPFGFVLSGMIPSAPIIPEAFAQTWAELPSTWMNVTGGSSVPSWIFRVGYPSSPFTVNIEVAGVTDLFAWEFKLSWNASLVDFVSTSEGSFLSGGVPGTTDFYSEAFQDQVDLDYMLVNCTLLSGSGKSGSGMLATVNFDVDASASAGSTSLDLYETKMLNSSQAIISHGVTDGFVFVGDHQMYPLIYMLPQTCVADPSERFNVTVWIDNVESLQAWGFELKWTLYLLEATSIVNHVFLEGTSIPISGLDNLNGRAYAAATLSGPQPGTYGSGRLATVNFLVEAAGKSALNLIVTDTDLWGINYPAPIFTYPIPHAVSGGLFRSSKPAASFTFTPQPLTIKPAANQTILFNATESADPGGLGIISYAWEFGDGDTATESDPIATHAYISPGSYTANLTVTNSEGKSSETSRIVDVVVRDIAVTSVKVSHKVVMQNTLANVSVTVKNEGNDKENFLMEAYVWKQSTSTLLGSYNVTIQTAGAVATRYFIWDTTGYDLDDYTIQGTVPSLTAENNVDNNEITVPIKLGLFNLIDYPTQSGSQTFHVIVESNSTLPYPSPFIPTSYEFNETALEISFNVTGSASAFGYLNATIPKTLLSSQPLDAWVILFDGFEVTNRVITENASHTFVYFNYTLSEHKVQIIGTQAGTPPIAAFTVEPTEQFYFTKEILAFNATGSSDFDGRITTYFFDFNDKSNATGTANYDGTGNLINVTWAYNELGKTPSYFTTLTPEVEHNFTKVDLLDFTFNVTLTVTDNDGFITTAFALLKIFDAYDIAITAITVPKSTVNITETASVNVTVINKLKVQAALTINVSIYGNQTKLASNTFAAPNLGTTLEARFELNTTEIGLGIWTLNATVEVIRYGSLSPPNFPTEDPSNLFDNKLSYGSLTIKKYDSALTIQVTPASLTYGSQVIVNGQVTPAMTGARITLESKLGDASFANLTTVSTRLGGQFTYVWAPAQAGTYQLRASWLGDAFTSSNVSSAQTVVVRQVSSTVSIDVTPSSITLGSSASINGKIDPSRSNVQVTVYYRLSGGEWASLPATSTDAQGNYVVQWQPAQAETYDVQAKWAGDVNTMAGESDIKQLKVESGGWPFDPLYIVAGALIIIAAVAVIFFLRKRKSK